MENRKREAGGSSFIVKEKKAFVIGITALFVIILDQITKFIVSNNITKPVVLIKGIFQLVHVKNTGAGFGILKNQQILLIFVAVFVIGLIMFYYDKIPAKKSIWIFIGLVLGGTIGNLIDRIRLGYVVDFLDFMIWPSFNAADSAITIGAIGLAIWMIRS